MREITGTRRHAGTSAWQWLVVLAALILLGLALVHLGRELAPAEQAPAPRSASAQADEESQELMPAAEAARPLLPGSPDVESAPAPAPSTEDSPEPNTSSRPLPPDHVDVTVVDAQGQPVEGASVLVCSRIPTASPDDMRRSLEAMLTTTNESPATARQAAREVMRTAMRDAMNPPIDWEHPLATWLTDAEGRCRVPLPDAESRLFAQRDGVGTSGLWACYRDESANDPQNLATRVRTFSDAVTLELQPQALVEGVVQDDRGLPIRGATVEVSNVSARLGHEAIVPRYPIPATSDEDGRFTLPLDAPCRATVQAARGDSRTLEVDVDLQPSQTGRIKLAFPGAYSVTGHVLSADRTPLAGAEVSTRVRGASVETWTDANGGFALALAEAGEYSLKAERIGRPVLVQSAAARVVVTDDEPEGVAEIMLLPSREVGGTAVWSTGEPASGVLVMADVDTHGMDEAARKQAPDISWMDTSRPDGSFRIESLHPEYPVTVWTYIPPGVEARVDGVMPGTMDIQLVLDREAAEGSTLVLDVIDGDTGAPVPSYEVEYGDWNNGLADYSAEKAIVNTPGGRFIWEHARIDSQCAFVIHARGYADLQLGPVIAAKDGAAVKARLGRLGSIEVVVLDASGSPVPGALVLQAGALSDTFDRYDDPSLESTDETGTAHFRSSAPGRYVLQARASGKASDLVRLDVHSGGTGRATLTLLDAWAAGDLEVIVLNSDATAIAGTNVNVILSSDFGEHGSKDGRSLDGQTDASGRRVFTGLEPGLYWVWPEVDGGFIAPLQAQVYSGHSTTLRFSPDQ